jgi:2-polyprenyl-6-methoxyphenol hydroxylase-like FAD-dependent oxidoreductase
MSSTAIVIGASMAGLVAARALSDHVDHVLVLERDEHLGDESRRGVPQGRHAHVILAAGERRLEQWFPGLGADLLSAGGTRGLMGHGWWWQGGGFRLVGDYGPEGSAVSRPKLEGIVRRRLSQVPNVDIRSGFAVDALSLADGYVVGVTAERHHIPADLVVDCSGRNTRFLAQLTGAGFPEPPMSVIKNNVSYGTRTLRRTPHDMDGLFAVVAATPPAEPRGGVATAIEGDRWIVTLAGMHGDTVPTDDEGYLAFARSFPTPIIADLLERTEALSPVMSYRYPANQRRHFERLRRYPSGFVALGDAVCSFNPVYGQGMSSAILQAVQLGRAAARHDLHSPRFPAAFYRRAAKVVDNPWRIAAGADFTHPATTGPKAPGTDLVNRYVHHVVRSTHVSRPVLERMMEVQSLLRPASHLMTPAMMARVLLASRRSPARLRSPAPDLVSV